MGPSGRLSRRLCLVVALAALACGAPVETPQKGNPLIGRWIPDPDLLPPGAALESGLALEFTESSLIVGDESKAMTYEVQDGRVVVTDENGNRMWIRLKDRDHIALPQSSSTPALHLVRVGS